VGKIKTMSKNAWTKCFCTHKYLGADRNPFPVQCLTISQALARFSVQVACSRHSDGGIRTIKYFERRKKKGEETGERAKRTPVLIFQRMPFHPRKTANSGHVTSTHNLLVVVFIHQSKLL